MNKLAKTMARREGFTLVELIVVIAILGILAGIAIPVYSGYISKAQEASDMTQLDAVKTAVDFAITENSYMLTGGPYRAKTITVTGNSVTATYTNATGTDEEWTAYTTLGADVAKLYNNGASTFSFTFKSDRNKAEYSATTNTWTLSKTTSP